MPLILAGDVGGTKTILVIFGSKKKIFERKYKSLKFKSLGEMIKYFLKEAKLKVKAAALGLPGPVVNDACKVTNLPWTVKKKDIVKATGIKKVRLLNDFEAICYGTDMLAKKDVVKLSRAKAVKNAAKAVIGAGTGLGEAIMFWSGNSYFSVATEGGHAEFSARNELEWKLKKFMQKKYGYASYERLLSGHGLVLIYNFLADAKYAEESEKVKNEMKKEDVAAIITKYGLSKKDKLCNKSLEMFVSFYGREAGNLALKANALGGVYLAGGITPKILPKLKTKLFLNEFTQRGKLTHLMERIPVFAIKNEEVGLMGVAKVARILA